jgi:nitroimidazol reductase NimA-like FMN-containing flavoprotein (pyridoxamine 5'-phosphate oxidase superfamily)
MLYESVKVKSRKRIVTDEERNTSAFNRLAHRIMVLPSRTVAGHDESPCTNIMPVTYLCNLDD